MSLASAPESGGTAAISSGAVYTALSGKIGIADAFGLGNNTEIPNDANLDSYKTAGIFIRSSAPNPSTMLNTPFGGDYQAKAFKLIVEYINSENNIRQTLIPLNENTGYFMRIRMTGVNGTWRKWYYYSGVEVVPPASLNSVNPAQLQAGAPQIDDETR